MISKHPVIRLSVTTLKGTFLSGGHVLETSRAWCYQDVISQKVTCTTLQALIPCSIPTGLGPTTFSDFYQTTNSK